MPLTLRRISPCPSPGWEGATSAPAGWARPCLSVPALQPPVVGLPLHRWHPLHSLSRPGEEGHRSGQPTLATEASQSFLPTWG